MILQDKIAAQDAVVKWESPVGSTTTALGAKVFGKAAVIKVCLDLVIAFMAMSLVCIGLKQVVPGYLMIVGTSSISKGVYWVDTRQSNATLFERGEVATFHFKPSQDWLKLRYDNNQVFSKMVLGLPGDQLALTVSGELKVCQRTGECFKAGTPKTLDSKGRPLYPWISHPYELKADEVWVYGPNPKSLDSRYYGPLKATEILGKATLLWAWSSEQNHPELAQTNTR